jgi:hypothetical protein
VNPDSRVQLELEFSRREAARHKREQREQFRRDHPEATGSDAAIDGVMEIMAMVGRA